ncbi:19730_t:CDS:1, partial [Gigaspora margarita]
PLPDKILQNPINSNAPKTIMAIFKPLSKPSFESKIANLIQNAKTHPEDPSKQMIITGNNKIIITIILE